MPENEEFRDALRAVIRRNDPSPDELRDAAAGMEQLADKWEDANDLI